MPASASELERNYDVQAATNAFSYPITLFTNVPAAGAVTLRTNAAAMNATFYRVRVHS